MRTITNEMSTRLLQTSDGLIESIKKALAAFSGGYRFAPWVQKRNALAQDAETYPHRAFGEIAVGNLSKYRVMLLKGISDMSGGNTKPISQVAKLYLSLSKQFDFDTDWMTYDDRKAFESALDATIGAAAEITEAER